MATTPSSSGSATRSGSRPDARPLEARLGQFQFLLRGKVDDPNAYETRTEGRRPSSSRRATSSSRRHIDGRGFAGGVKRYHFSGVRRRTPERPPPGAGLPSAGTTPVRVRKVLHMAGHHG